MNTKKILLCFILILALTMSGTVMVFAAENENTIIVAETENATNDERNMDSTSTDGAVETPAPEEEPDPPSIIIKSFPASIEVGESSSLSVAVNNTDSEVSWKSSDSNIISIDSLGNITAQSPGTAKITASADGAKDTVSITVNEIKPEEIKIVSDDFGLTSAVTGYELKVGDIVQLKIKVDPKEATISGIKWEVSDPEIAKIDDDGMLTALDNGDVTVTATADNDMTAKMDIKVSSNIPWVIIAIVAVIALIIILLIIAIIRKKMRNRGRRPKRQKQVYDYDDDDDDDDDNQKPGNSNRPMTEEELEREKERLRQEAYRQGYEDREREMTKVFNPKDFEFDDEDKE